MNLAHFCRVQDSPFNSGLVYETASKPFENIWLISVEGFSVAGTGSGVAYLQFHVTDGIWGLTVPQDGAVPVFQMQIPEGQTFAYRPPNGRRLQARDSYGVGDALPNRFIWALSTNPYVFETHATARALVDIEYALEPLQPAFVNV